MNLAETAVLIFLAFCAAGALSGLAFANRRLPLVLAALGAAASVAAIVAGAAALVFGQAFEWRLWPVLDLGTMVLRLDRLSGLFLLVTGLVYFPVSLYSRVYLLKYLGHYSLRYFSFLYFFMFSAIGLVLISGDMISFLVAWELMSISSYLLVTYDRDQAESSSAAYVMLAMSEMGMVAVIVAFILLANLGGSTNFTVLRSAHLHLNLGPSWAVFLLSFSGFAVKAGLVPVNSWLPLAHPVAPTNVSALLSSIIVNLGVYGIIRTNVDIAPPAVAGPGLVVLFAGSLSAVVGILYATTQAEMKRLLAHSTIENMGIVAAGVGAAMVFSAEGHAIAAGIALIAALYHLTNHSIYKALLFIGVGAVEKAAGSRDLDRLGGLARGMPWTSALFLVGVLSIAALPPLNGFVSEWLTLQTILRSAILASTPIKMVFAISGVLLALTAGLAVTCFVKVFAMGFLGMPRSEGAATARESQSGVRAPLAMLGAVCILLGLGPTYVIPALDVAVATLARASVTPALVPPFFEPAASRREGLPKAFLADFHDLGADTGAGIAPGRGLVVLHRGGEANPVVFAMSTTYMLAGLAAVILATYLIFRLATRGRQVRRGEVWAGGLRRLTPEATYTATGFSNPVRVIFQAVLRPITQEYSTEAVALHFRTAIRRSQTEAPIIDRIVLGRLVRLLDGPASLARRMHVGNVNAYAAYVLLTVLAVLLVGAVVR
jgi:hydrogenase-4 component B